MYVISTTKPQSKNFNCHLGTTFFAILQEAKAAPKKSKEEVGNKEKVCNSSTYKRKVRK